MNAKERTQLIGLLNYFEVLFGGTLRYCSTYSVDLELKTDSKTLNCKYYPVPRANKETFFNDLERLVKIVDLTPVQQYQ